MRHARISAPSRPHHLPGGAQLLWTGMLAAFVCAPLVASAQTAPTAPPSAQPHYRGIVTVPPASGHTAAAPWVTPPPPSAPPPAADALPASPATPEASAYRGESPAQGRPGGAVTGRPIIRDTATLVIDGRAILVAGIEGVGGAPLSSFKDFVEAAGGTVTCVPAPGISTYTCHLSDGSDLATIALLNGAARLGSDAPAAYRMQEEIARTNHRGIWASYRQSSDRDLAASSSVRPLPPFGGVSPRPLAAPQQVFAYRPNPR